MKNLLILFLCVLLCQLARVVTAKVKVRITSNELARPSEFPYQVSLQERGYHVCGGSLISKRHVLTAAHCVHKFVLSGKPNSMMKVAVGTTTIPGGIYHDVDRIAYHPNYSRENPPLNADVAVIRLTTPVVESRNVRVIALPAPNLVLQPNQKLITSGFGAAVLHGAGSPRLKKLVMSYVPRATCEQHWGGTVSRNIGFFCANTPTRAGVCQGDSGGPLTIDKKVVVGITSATSKTGCGTKFPDLFTSVTQYLDFIRSEVQRG